MLYYHLTTVINTTHATARTAHLLTCVGCGRGRGGRGRESGDVSRRQRQQGTHRMLERAHPVQREQGLVYMQLVDVHRAPQRDVGAGVGGGGAMRMGDAANSGGTSGLSSAPAVAAAARMAAVCSRIAATSSAMAASRASLRSPRSVRRLSSAASMSATRRLMEASESPIARRGSVGSSGEGPKLMLDRFTDANRE